VGERQTSRNKKHRGPGSKNASILEEEQMVSPMNRKRKKLGPNKGSILGKGWVVKLQGVKRILVWTR
jgi:hypothetical protein